jgi:predicted permease
MNWLKQLFIRRRRYEELSETIREHFDEKIADLMDRGMTQDEAERAARREFGNVTLIEQRSREVWQWPTLESVWSDIRFALRQLARSPTFTAIAILTLAIGLGANAAIFSLINGLLLRPLQVPHPEDLAVLRIDQSNYGTRGPNYSFSAPLFRALENRDDLFQHIAGFESKMIQVRIASGNQSIAGAVVSGEFFDTLETPPLMGRYLNPQDDQLGGPSGGFGVVISEDFWRHWLDSAPDVVGRRLTIANAPFTIVGVMPKRFIGADPTQRPEFYVPLSAEPIIDYPVNSIAGGYQSWWISIIGRRKAGVSLEQVNAALRAASNPILYEAIPDAKWIERAQSNHFQITAEPGAHGYSDLRAVFQKPLLAVFALCAVMLLLACFNLASLLMARSAARERELATRLALGASRKRLVQQLLIESLVLATLGTIAGSLAVPLVGRALARFILGNNPAAVLDTAIDLRVFIFLAVMTGVAAVVIGLVPALRATSGSLNEQIKSGAHSTGPNMRRVLPNALLSMEVALALILVVGAGLLTTSVVKLYRTGLGFDPSGVALLSLQMGKQGLDADALIRWYQTYGDALSHQPGVRSATFASVVPLSGNMSTREYQAPLSNGEQEIYINRVAPQYFDTMRIPLFQGRDFQWSDTASTNHKIILNQAASKLLFPSQNPLGRIVTDPKGVPYEVVAVVGDTRYDAIRNADPAGAYLPIMQNDAKKPSYTAVVRMDGPAAPLSTAARLLTAKMASSIPAPVLTTMTDELDISISTERMMAILAIFFAGCALFVTAIGLYGTLAYATAQRTSEIGIRMALGARRIRVMTMIFRENLLIAALGSVGGLIIAWMTSRVFSSFLYGTSVHDPWVLIGSVMALILVTSVASLIPAVKASQIEPITALRAE